MSDIANKAAGSGKMSKVQRAWLQGLVATKAPDADAGGGSGGAAGLGSDRALDATDTDLFFDKDSHTLSKSDRDALERYAKAYLAANGTDPITIEAWASKDGDEKHNRELADARAKTVQDFLAGQHVPKDRLKAAGLGATDKFSKDALAQNRRATLAPPPAAAGAAQGTAERPSPANAGSGDQPVPKGLGMRGKSDGTPLDDPLHKDDSVRHTVGDSTDVPRAQVERELKAWLDALSSNQPDMKGKVRGTDHVAEAERRLHKGLPGEPAMPRGDDKDYDPGALAKKIADNLPPTIPAENVADFRKLSARDAPKQKTTTEALHDKYVQERDDLVKQLPESLRKYAKEGLDAVVEKGVPYTLDKGFGAANVGAALQGQLKQFAETWAKKITGSDDGSGDK